MMRVCEVDGCDRPHWTHGWCKGHYTRWRNHGDPLGERKLKPCGTYAAGRRHQAHGEEPCQECVEAMREYRRAYRARPGYREAAARYAAAYRRRLAGGQA